MKNFEVEPLCVTLGVHVILQPEIVFDVIHLDGASEVPSFETRLKYQNVILMWHVNRVLVIGLAYNFNALISATYTTVKFPLRSKLG